MKLPPTSPSFPRPVPDSEAEVIEAQTMKREDYKRIKHMNKDQLTMYMSRIYLRGYNKGVEDTIIQINNPNGMPAPQVPE